MLGISINGDALAYPIRILNYHEIVNDTVGGTSVVITYCPLCGSGTAFEADIDGQFKAYPFEELEDGTSSFQDEFAGVEFDVEFDAKHRTARILDTDGIEIPTTMAFWFAWYAFHPETDVYEAQ